MLTPFNNPLIADDLAVRFLRLILPEQGYLIAAIRKRAGSNLTSSLRRRKNCGRLSRTPIATDMRPIMLARVSGNRTTTLREHRMGRSNSAAQNAML